MKFHTGFNTRRSVLHAIQLEKQESAWQLTQSHLSSNKCKSGKLFRNTGIKCRVFLLEYVLQYLGKRSETPLLSVWLLWAELGGAQHFVVNKHVQRANSDYTRLCFDVMLKQGSVPLSGPTGATVVLQNKRAAAHT